jgi:tRNA modification GTPase
MEAFVEAGAEAVAWPAVVADLPAARDPLCRAAFIALPTARSRLEAEILSRQAIGALSEVFAPCAADLEAFLQDERPDDLPAFHRAAKTLLQGAPLARAFEEPPLVVLTGAPNAGKSTLFNALLGEERALVHAAPGTTRDTVTETALFFGVPVLLCDTAGLTPHPSDPVEAEGVRRARALLDRARLLLHLGTSPPKQAPVLQLAAKADLPGPRTGLPVSAKTGWGLDRLRREVLGALGLPPDPAASPPPPYPGAFSKALAEAEQAAAQVLDAPKGSLDRLTDAARALCLWREKSP